MCTAGDSHCFRQILYSCSIGTDVNFRKYKHQNVPIAYPNSKYKCRQFTQFSMGTKNKQSSAKCLVLVDKLRAHWSCSLTKLYRRLLPPQTATAAPPVGPLSRRPQQPLARLRWTYRASTMVALGEVLSKKYLRQISILVKKYEKIKALWFWLSLGTLYQVLSIL